MIVNVDGYDCVLDDDCVLPKGKLSIRIGWNDTPYLYIGGKSAHRIITCAPKGMLVDHINHNTLDNRRENLRVCTRSQNMWNRKRTCGSSKYKGVHFHSKRKQWRAEIYKNDERAWSGVFASEEEAAVAYNNKAKELFGEFACLNQV